MSNSLNYMDDVPVKISERFKPPPKISLPQSIRQRLNGNHANNPLQNGLDYNFQLERNVLGKISEWKTIRQQDMIARRERQRIRQEEQNREMQQKQKEMLTAVSYPSTEDLSSDDDVVIVEQHGPKPSPSGVGRMDPLAFSPNSFYTILVPTVCPEQNTQHQPLSSGIINFNYSDFESDNSSPFDTVALKTLNDLDMLAEVLKKSSTIHSNHVPDNLDNKQIVDTNNSNRNQEINEHLVDSNNCIVQSNQPPVQVDVQQQPVIDNTYHSNQFFQQPIHQTRENYNQSSDGDSSTSNIQSLYNYNSIGNYPNQIVTGVSQPMNYYQYPNQYPNQMPILYPTSSNGYSQPYPEQQPEYKLYQFSTIVNHPKESYFEKRMVDGLMDDGLVRSKSKSVPDIVRELDAELMDAQLKRNRNNSQSQTNNPSKHRNGLTPPKSQKAEPVVPVTVKEISSMGFPIDRVTRIFNRFGIDDKKQIVDHLIALSELLVLGFDETNISEALIKFDNNKEKALDFLIT